jgi:hypothetical protein
MSRSPGGTKQNVAYYSQAYSSLITTAPAYVSLCHRLVTFIETHLASGEVSEEQLAIYTKAQQRAIFCKAATKDANNEKEKMAISHTENGTFKDMQLECMQTEIGGLTSDLDYSSTEAAEVQAAKQRKLQHIRDMAEANRTKQMNEHVACKKKREA